jgi:hypothetical protein
MDGMLEVFSSEHPKISWIAHQVKEIFFLCLRPNEEFQLERIIGISGFTSYEYMIKMYYPIIE